MSTAPIQSVIDNDLCIACGACIYACPAKTVSTSYSSFRGAEEVKVNDTNHCQQCKSLDCGEVCPSIDTLLDKKYRNTSRLGPVEQVKIAYSPRHQENGVSSSGGVIREICYEYLREGVPVICLTENRQDEKVWYQASRLKSLEEMSRVPGSIYHSVSFANAIELIERSSSKIVIVSIPCHLEGIENYIAKVNPTLNEKIACKVGIICGWMYTNHSLLNFSSSMNIKDSIVDARYRGEDKVGKLKIYTKDGVQSFNRRKFNSLRLKISYRSSFSTDMNRLRCRLCQNHINVGADVSVGDAWLKRTESEKLSIIVSRTERGKRLIEKLESQQRVICSEGSIEDIEESQSKNLVYSYEACNFSSYLSRHGIVAPKYPYQNVSVPTMFEKIKYRLGMKRRALIRNEKYRAYRLLYILTKPLVVVSYWIKRK